MEDDINVIVEDTNIQLELENKLLYDLMESLKYEPEQEKNEKLVQNVKKEAESLPDGVLKKTKFQVAVLSHGKDLIRLEERGIPIIVIETEEEWKIRQSNEKTPGQSDKNTLPGETTPRSKQSSKQEDREFDINMAHFQNKLSEVIKQDTKNPAKYKDNLSSILEELESQVQNETSYCEERNSENVAEEEFKTAIRASEKGQYFCATSEHPISSDTSELLLYMDCNKSVDAEELELDLTLSSTFMDNSVRDSQISIESERSSEPVEADNGPSYETVKNPAVSSLDSVPKIEIAGSDERVYYSTEVINKPSFRKIENLIIDPTSDYIFDMPSEALEGGSSHELPPFPECVFERNNMEFLGQAIDNIDVLGQSSSGILSRSDAANEELASADLGPKLHGRNLEERFELPIIVSNRSDDRTKMELLHDERELTAGLDDDKSSKTLSRNPESWTENNKELKSAAYNASVANYEKITSENIAVVDEWEDRSKIEGTFEDNSEFNFTMEEKHLISFEDDEDVIVGSQDVPQTQVLQGTTMSDMEKGFKGNDIPTKTSRVEDGENVSTRSNETQANSCVDKDILVEEKKIEFDLQKAGMDFGKTLNELGVEREKDRLDNDTNFGKDVSPEIGTLVDILPHCEEGTEYFVPEPAGITGAINSSSEYQILSNTQTCTNMNLSENSKITGRVDDVENENQVKQALVITLKETEKQRYRDNTVTSCEQVAESSCGYECFNSDSGNEPGYQSNEIQATMVEMNIYLKEEAIEDLETKIEPIFCGFTKRPREQGAEIVVGLKKLKIDDTSEQGQGQEMSWYAWPPLNNALCYVKEQQVQTSENKECEKEEDDHIFVEAECCVRVGKLDIAGENKYEKKNDDKENCLFPPQEAVAKDETNNRNVMENVEEIWNVECEVGTSQSTTGKEMSTRVVEQEVVPVLLDKSIELESLERLDNLNYDMDIFYNDHAVFSNDRQVTLNFEATQKDFSATRGVGEVSAIDADSVEVLSKHLNEIDEKDKKETLYEVTFVQITAESRGRDEGTQELNPDVVTQRVTEDAGHKRQTHAEGLETKQEAEEDVTQRDEKKVTEVVMEDATINVTQGTEQEEHICLKDFKIEDKLMEDMTQRNEQRVTQDVKEGHAIDTEQEVESCLKDFGKEDKMEKDELRVTQDNKAGAEIKVTPETQQGDQTSMKDFEMEQKLMEDVTQEEKGVTQGSNQDVEINVTQDTNEKKTHPQTHGVTPEFIHAKRVPDIAQELAKGLVLQENDFEEDQSITQKEEKVTQDVTQTVTPEIDQTVTQPMKQKPVNQVGAAVVEPKVTQDFTRVTTPSYQDITQYLEKAEVTPVQQELSRNSKLERGSIVEHEVTQPVQQQMTQWLTQQGEQEKGEEIESDVEHHCEMHRKKEEVSVEREQEVTQVQKVTQQVEEEVTHVKEVIQHAEEELKPEFIDDIRQIEIETGETEVMQKEERTLTNEGVNENSKHLNVIQEESHLEEVKPEQEDDVTEYIDGVLTQPQTGKERKLEAAQNEMQELEEKPQYVKRQDDILSGTSGNREEERGNVLLEEQSEIVIQPSKDAELKDLENEMLALGINYNSRENIIESSETKVKTTKEEPSHGEMEGMDYKSSETQGKDENEIASSKEMEKDEDKENRIRSFEMLIHLETIIKELDIYRCEQNRLRESFKICMNEVMSNLSSMTKAVHLVETRLNQKIKDAHEEMKTCCVGNLETKSATKLSMDALLKSYNMTQAQFGDLRQRVKDLEMICAALNVSEMQRELSHQVSAEIDTMDKRIKFTENDVSDLKLRVTELETECSSLRKLTPMSEERLEVQVGNGEFKIDRTTTSFYKYNTQFNDSRTESSLGRMKENEDKDLSLVRSSATIGSRQRYYGLHSEEV